MIDIELTYFTNLKKKKKLAKNEKNKEKKEPESYIFHSRYEAKI
jgi:hypothetical protein